MNRNITIRAVSMLTSIHLCNQQSLPSYTLEYCKIFLPFPRVYQFYYLMTDYCMQNSKIGPKFPHYGTHELYKSLLLSVHLTDFLTTLIRLHYNTNIKDFCWVVIKVPNLVDCELIERNLWEGLNWSWCLKKQIEYKRNSTSLLVKKMEKDYMLRELKVALGYSTARNRTSA